MSAPKLATLRSASFLVGAGLAAAVGCSSNATTAPAVTHPTMIAVSPDDFLGDVPCSTSSSGLKRYVATLFDLNRSLGGVGGEGGDSAIEPGTGAGGAVGVPFQLPSSAPTSCLTGVGFGYVVAGRSYRVEIDGYDTDAVFPRAEGARQMVSPAPTQDAPVTPLLAPRWTAACERATAVDATVIRADHCTTFAADLEAPAGLHVALAPLLGALHCGNEPGQVAELDVTASTAGGLSRAATVACSPTAEAVFNDFTGGELVTVYVSARAKSSDPAALPLAGAACNASTRAGATVEAQCSLLSQIGTLRVDLRAALDVLALACRTDSVTAVEVKTAGQEGSKVFPPPDCLQPFDQGFPPGPATVTVTARRGDDAVGTATCSADIVPGKLVTAGCEPGSD